MVHPATWTAAFLGAVAVLAAAPAGAKGFKVYFCGYINGEPWYSTQRIKGRKCRLHYSEKERNRPQPGEKCRTYGRYGGDTIVKCVKDGIARFYNRRADVKRGAAGSGPRAPGPPASSGGLAPMTIGASRDELDGIIERAARKHDIPGALIKAVIYVESRFQPAAVSPAGAQGLMQLMPVTADYLGVADPFDPEDNVSAGTRLLRRLADRFDGDLELTIAAYYAGPTAVERAGGIPTEQCRDYVRAVMQRYREYADSGGR